MKQSSYAIFTATITTLSITVADNLSILKNIIVERLILTVATALIIASPVSIANSITIQDTHSTPPKLQQQLQKNDVTELTDDLKKMINSTENERKIIFSLINVIKEHSDQTINIFKYLSGTKDQIVEPLVKALLGQISRGQITIPSTTPNEEKPSINSVFEQTQTKDELLKAIAAAIENHPDQILQILEAANEKETISREELIAASSESIKKTLLGVPAEVILALGTLATLTALGGGSGGGGSATCGGGNCTEVYTPDSFVTTEYNAQEGLALVNAKNIYAYGGTGSGVKVAIIDSGLHTNHSEFTGRISDGYDLNDGSSTVTSDQNGHGTHVAGIVAGAKDEAGMHGIAYEAIIVPIKVGSSSDGRFILNTDNDESTVFLKATTSGARIFNNSWGTSVPITSTTKSAIDASRPLTLTQMQSSVNSGAVFIWAAGNNYSLQPSVRAGLPYYYSALQPGWLAVMAVDLDGNKASYTNMCGVSAAWCLAAPGGGGTSTTGIYSTYNDGSYKRLSGTSMAAPHVSGALAALKSRFPNLTYHQVRDRLLTTANSSGIYADNSIYGQGLMDLNAAASPVGVTMFTLSDTDTGLTYTTAGSNLNLPASVYSAFASRLAETDLMIVDSYQRAPFYTTANQFIFSNKTEFSTDFFSLFPEDRSYSNNGVTLFKSNGEVTSVTGSIAPTKDTAGINWFIGEKESNHLHRSLGLNSQLLPVSGSSVGFSVQWGENDLSATRFGAWAITPQKGPTDSTAKYLIPNYLQSSATLPSFKQGMGIRKSHAIDEHFYFAMSTGIGIPKNISAGLSSAGAFSSSTESGIYTGGSLGYSTKSLSIDFDAQYVRINSKNRASLLHYPSKIDLNDFNFTVSKSYDGTNGLINLSMGKTMLVKDINMTLSLPTSINESGQVNYVNLTESLTTLYDHTHLSVISSYQISEQMILAGAATLFGPSIDKIDDQYFFGAAVKIDF